MRVLVSGGAGFIGSHVVDELRAAGLEVAALDDLSTGRRENLPAEVKLYVADLRDREAVLSSLRDFRPTHVVHQAAQASVKGSIDDPAHDAAVNLLGGIHLLDAAREQKVSRVVFASTGGAIYGEVAGGALATEGWPARPKSPYAAAKASFELYLSVYRQCFDLSSVVLRYSNVYGPRQNPHGEAGVVAIFARRILAGEPVTLYGKTAPGDGGCLRDYVYVGDVARANLLALRLPVASTGTGGNAGDEETVFNVCTGQAHSTSEVLAAIAAAAGKSPSVQHAPPRIGDLESSCLDPARLVARGWSPTVPLLRGIDQTVASFRAAR